MIEATRAMVIARIVRVFPDRDPDEIFAILDRYGTERHEHERDRVQLAILKLCDEGGRDDPADYVEAAKQDFRDVLAWVESPNLMRQTFVKDPEKRAELKRRDEEQYKAWLEKP